MQLELTEADRELLVEILQGRLGELREEVYHATISTYKDELKTKEVALAGLLQSLGAEQAS
jgi:hypothetical protein